MTEAISDTLNRLTVKLQGHGIDDPRLDGRLLIAAAVGKEPKEILLHDTHVLSSEQLSRVEDYVDRRIGGEPVSRIIGEREFWSLPFKLSTGTLDPRPDSETLIAATLAAMSDKPSQPKSILDVGTGTGCLLLSLLKEWPNAQGAGIDIEPDAVHTARINAAQVGVENRAVFFVADWCSGLNGNYDVIISNPPYICSSDIDNLQPEVKSFDPMLALDGGPDGLAAFKQLVPICRTLLASKGLLVLEHGAGQNEDVVQLLSTSGLEKIESHKDLSGRMRCITCWAP